MLKDRYVFTSRTSPGHSEGVVILAKPREGGQLCPEGDRSLPEWKTPEATRLSQKSVPR